MKTIYKITSLIAIGFFLFLTANWLEASLSRNDTGYIQLGKLSFHSSLDEGIQESRNQSKPVFMYFRSETCYWCMKFEEESLSDETVIDILDRNFILISIDTFKQKNTALNLNVRTTPYMIFFDKDGQEVSRIPGYIPKEEFIIKLNTVLGQLKSQTRE